jgi:hypothetical protein
VLGQTPAVRPRQARHHPPERTGAAAAGALPASSGPPRSPGGHPVPPASGKDLRYGLRPPRGLLESTQPKIIKRWPRSIPDRHAARSRSVAAVLDGRELERARLTRLPLRCYPRLGWPPGRAPDAQSRSVSTRIYERSRPVPTTALMPHGAGQTTCRRCRGKLARQPPPICRFVDLSQSNSPPTRHQQTAW